MAAARATCFGLLISTLLGCNGLTSSDAEPTAPEGLDELDARSLPTRPTPPATTVATPVPGSVEPTETADAIETFEPTEIDLANCKCPQSESLRALSCGAYSGAWFHSTPAGDTIIYSVNSHSYRWTRAAGIDLVLARSEAIRVSDAAQDILFSQLGSSDLMVWRANAPSDIVSSMLPVDMSADGRIVLMWEPSTRRSVVWTRERGTVAIAQDDAEFGYRAEFAARDGSAFVGLRETIEPPHVVEPVLWTDRDGQRVLGPLPAGAQSGKAWGVTTGGAVVAGSLVHAAGHGLGVYRWTERDGMNIVLPNGGAGYVLMSDDGNTLVSPWKDTSTGGTRSIVARWTASSGIELIDPGEERSAEVTAMTADGNIIVGASTPLRIGASGDYLAAFIWRADLGMVDLNQALASTGVDLDGWRLDAPTEISADGRVFVGNGQCGGVVSVYRLELPF